MERGERSGRGAWASWAQAAAVLGGACALVSCTTVAQQGGAASPEVDLGKQEAQPVAVDPPRDATPSNDPAASRKVAELPAEFRSIGEPCPKDAAQKAMQGIQITCGRGDRIAGITTVARGAAGPAIPEPVMRHDGAAGPARVHVDSQHLWIASTCAMCRLPTESLWIGDLSLVTDQQLAEVQAGMGLPAKPALRDEKSWRRAIARKD